MATGAKIEMISPPALNEAAESSECRNADAKDQLSSESDPKHQTAEVLSQVVDFLRMMRERYCDNPLSGVEPTDGAESGKSNSAFSKRGDPDSATNEIARNLALFLNDDLERSNTASTGHMSRVNEQSNESQGSKEHAKEQKRTARPRRATTTDNTRRAGSVSIRDAVAGFALPSIARPLQRDVEHETIAQDSQQMTFTEYLQHPLGMSWLRKIHELGAEQLQFNKTVPQHTRSVIEDSWNLHRLPLLDISAPSSHNSSVASSTTSALTEEEAQQAQERRHGDFLFMGSHSGTAAHGESALIFDDIIDGLPPFIAEDKHSKITGTAISSKHASPSVYTSAQAGSLPTPAFSPPCHSRAQSLQASSENVPIRPSSPTLFSHASAPASLSPVSPLIPRSSPSPIAFSTRSAAPGASLVALSPDKTIARSEQQSPPRVQSHQPVNQPKRKRQQSSKDSTKAQNCPKGSGDNKRVIDRRKRRRESHNAVERRRRDLINERIAEMAALLPEPLLLEAIASSTGGGTATHIDMSILAQQCTCKQGDSFNAQQDHFVANTAGCHETCRRKDKSFLDLADSKPNKGVVLTKSVEYIKHLHEICGTLRRSNEDLQKQLDAIRHTVMGGKGSEIKS